jgi:hypothetical protein
MSSRFLTPCLFLISGRAHRSAVAPVHSCRCTPCRWSSDGDRRGVTREPDGGAPPARGPRVGVRVAAGGLVGGCNRSRSGGHRRLPERKQRRVARADYWLSYKLTFLTGERVIVAPTNGVDRYPPYTAAVRAEPSHRRSSRLRHCGDVR